MPSKKNGSKPATQADVQRLDKKIDRIGMELIKTREEMATKKDLKGLERNMERLLKIATDSAERGKTYFD